MQRQAKAAGASELAVPAAIQVVDKVPLLGSGKTDYVAATAMARDLASAPEQAPAAEREVA
jgi:acyl-[acyl-carrier-protein]-phospholipid O-acyltransferase/long-chain-fatty-acid--[acyl-carrier-protein] ligase